MNDLILGIVLVAVAGFILYDLAVLWASLRINASDWLLATGGMDIEAADGDDYTYQQRPEMLLPHYDVRTYPQITDERIEALEDEIRQLELRIRALEVR